MTAILCALALAVTACSSDEPDTSDSSETPEETTEHDGIAPDGPMPEPAAELADFYEQELSWTDCAAGADCARLTVPLDYSDPDRASIELAVMRRAADAPDPVGSLVLNPGGPGGSGIELVSAADFMFGDGLLAGFDVVGFDPRGVGESDAVTCLDDAEIDERRSAVYDTDTDEGLAEFVAAQEAFAAACQENTGELLGYVDTVSAARDMDVLRHVLGDPQLMYLGYSYGTSLGAVYADLFPENVGRLVLDGGLDPALDIVELNHGQAQGFEHAIRAYAEDCLAGPDCPLSGDVDDAVGQISQLFEKTGEQPLDTGTDRELTLGLLVSGLLLPLYEDQYWMLLTSALEAAMNQGDGSQFLFLADLMAQREADGSYTGNLQEANPAINCLDYPVVNTEIEQMRAEAEALEDLAPTFGSLFGFDEVGCSVWPHPSEAERGPISAPGAAPILVIGTTGDPATPYEWSVSLAEQLDSGVLVTYEGEGHTAYGRSNACIGDAVEGYLLRGEVPEDGLTC